MMGEIDRITEKFPGLDCGSCGAPSCRALAEDVVRGDAKESDCIFVLREEIRTMANMLESIGGFVPGNMHKEEKKEDSGS